MGRATECMYLAGHVLSSLAIALCKRSGQIRSRKLIGVQIGMDGVRGGGGGIGEIIIILSKKFMGGGGRRGYGAL